MSIGVWKMNVKTIRSKIFHESIEKIWPLWSNAIDSYHIPTAWWEMVKSKSKHLTIEISKSLNISKYKLTKIEKKN